MEVNLHFKFLITPPNFFADNSTHVAKMLSVPNLSDGCKPLPYKRQLNENFDLNFYNTRKTVLSWSIAQLQIANVSNACQSLLIFGI